MYRDLLNVVNRWSDNIKRNIHIGLKVLREEGLFIIINKAIAVFKLRYRKLTKRLREKVKKLRINVLIRTRWIILYTLRTDFRYMIYNPVFIVGCGHSGTTLLLRIVGAHHSFHAILDESYTFQPSQKPEILSLSNKLALIDLEAFRSGKKRWVEKTPMHIHYISNILQSRPKSKILLIIRDGRDVVVSIKRRTGDFEAGVKRWIDDNKAGEDWWNHKQVLVVQYESIIEKFNETVTSVMNFLGEEFSEQCYIFNLLYADREEMISTPGSGFGESHDRYRKWQAQQPLFNGRGKWMNEMTPEENQLFKTMAGEMLIKYGYAEDNNW